MPSLSMPPFMTLAALTALVTQRFHLLMALLSLEAMLLSLAFFIASSSALIAASQTFLILLILTFGACEASIGLACLVLLTRTSGKSLINSLNIMKC